MPHTIRCRAKLDGCLNGRPTEHQFGEDLPQDEDGSFLSDEEGGTIVCDPCYVFVCQHSPSGAGLHHEIPAAIEAARAARS